MYGLHMYTYTCMSPLPLYLMWKYWKSIINNLVTAVGVNMLFSINVLEPWCRGGSYAKSLLKAIRLICY